MGKKKEKGAAVRKISDDFGHEIWGLIFMATALLVIIAIVSHFVSPHNNILGYYFGTALATGLIYVFGPFVVFSFPLAIGVIGWQRFRGEPVDIRMFFFGLLLTIELCFLLAVHHLPHLVMNPLLRVDDNSLGFVVVRLIEPVFGSHTFGPYFIATLAIIVTSLLMSHIPPQRFFALIGIMAARIAAVLKEKWRIWQLERAALRVEQEERRAERQRLKEERRVEKARAVVLKPSDKKDDLPAGVVLPSDCYGKDSGGAGTAEEDNKNNEKPPEKDISCVEEEARLCLEQELAAFRAKRSDPIKIMTIETTEVEPPEYEEDLEPFPQDIVDGEPLEHKLPTTTSAHAVSVQSYVVPDPSVIPDPPPLAGMIDKDVIEQNSTVLEKTLMNFGVEGKVGFVSPGPVVTRYEIELAPGIKVSKVVNLHDDLSMAVGGQRIRIEAPIPGKSAVGIELPNVERQIVHFKHILLSEAFRKTKAKLPVVIGTNVSGAPYVTDVAKMPHVLIAGQTGSGKSVCINSLICSLLMTMKPQDLRLIMIDPKKVELAFYEGIPHLMSPVVTESKEAVKALQWGVIEMERRYRILAKVGARNIDSFNGRVESGNFSGVLSDEDNKKLPFIVIIVDELADLMMTASKDVEVLIQRIAQLARAVGLHLIVATQRPSVDIITGPIKANLTSRIAFRTIQSTDSRTILGHVGAEKLLGMGDMLFLRNGAPEIERFHGAFISEEDVEKIVSCIKGQQIEIDKIDSFSDVTGPEIKDDTIYADGDRDELFAEAARTIVSIGQGSTSMLQRRMKIGYARAGRLMDELERAGFVGPPDGSKARDVLVKPDEIEELLARLH